MSKFTGLICVFFLLPIVHFYVSWTDPESRSQTLENLRLYLHRSNTFYNIVISTGSIRVRSNVIININTPDKQ